MKENGGRFVSTTGRVTRMSMRQNQVYVIHHADLVQIIRVFDPRTGTLDIKCSLERFSPLAFIYAVHVSFSSSHDILFFSAPVREVKQKYEKYPLIKQTLL